jgi:DNA-binding NarL/FixJ family response regulator
MGKQRRSWTPSSALSRSDTHGDQLGLTRLDGFAVAERLAAAPEPPQIVLISSRDAAAYGPRIDAAPVRGFLAKRELSGAALAALVR